MLALALALPVPLSFGDDSLWPAVEDHRVLEAALRHVLLSYQDAKSPQGRELVFRPRKVLVLHRTTDGNGMFPDALAEAVKERAVSGALSDVWTKRNEGESLPVRDLKVDAALIGKNLVIAIDDMDALFDRTGGGVSYVLEFYKKYPESLGFLRVSLPGYSRDGRSAVVLMQPGPTDGYHPSVYVVKLARFQDRWNVVVCSRAVH